MAYWQQQQRQQQEQTTECLGGGRPGLNGLSAASLTRRSAALSEEVRRAFGGVGVLYMWDCLGGLERL